MGTEMTLMPNGHPTSEPWEEQAHRLDGFIERQREELRDLLAQERALVGQIQEALDSCKEREKRVLRALAALEGTAVAAKPTKAQKKAAWQISDEKVEEIYAAIRASIEANDGEPVTMTKVRESVGSSASETWRKAVDRLRADERLRVAGRVRGGGELLALMPEVDDAA